MVVVVTTTFWLLLEVDGTIPAGEDDDMESDISLDVVKTDSSGVIVLVNEIGLDVLNIIVLLELGPLQTPNIGSQFCPSQ